MESFRYHDLGRIAYADALEYQTAAYPRGNFTGTRGLVLPYKQRGGYNVSWAGTDYRLSGI